MLDCKENGSVIHLEDCVDCLKVMHPNNDFVFLFDHSSGHAKKRVDGLNAANMNVKHGGKQSHMRPSQIMKEDGYLGPFDKVLKVGDTQQFVWQAGDAGPFHFTDKEKDARVKQDDKVGIPTRLARKFGMKARSYICVYFAYETTDKDGVGRVSVGQSNSPNQPDPVPSFNYKQIQKLQKEFKVHRGAIDFDKAFIFKSIMQIEKGK